MKTKAIAFLILFMSFITLPTILSQTCDDVDISMAYNIAEEEEETHKCPSEVVQEFVYNHNEVNIYFFGYSFGIISKKYLLNHKNINYDIFLPPPEQKLV